MYVCMRQMNTDTARDQMLDIGDGGVSKRRKGSHFAFQGRGLDRLRVAVPMLCDSEDAECSELLSRRRRLRVGFEHGTVV